MNTQLINELKAEAIQSTSGHGFGKHYTLAYKRKIVEAVRQGFFNQKTAAEIAGCHYTSVSYWMRVYSDKSREPIAVRHNTPKPRKPKTFVGQLEAERDELKGKLAKLDKVIGLLREIEV